MSIGTTLLEWSGHALRRVRAFAACRRGNVAMIYALATVPLCFAAGAGLDYARGVVVRSNLSEAIDAAALAVGSTPGLTTDQMRTLAQQYFNANYRTDASYGTPAAISVVPTGSSVTITATDQMPTTLLSAVGYNTMNISVSTTVVWGQLKLWVALVLDNTGSMTETDNNHVSKITALKSASHQLLTMLQNASANPGDVEVSIVPFTKDVNVGASNYNASWLDWTTWDASNGSNQQVCGGNNGNGWGWGWGWGWGNCTTTWVPDNHNTWNGCVMDRGASSSANVLNTDVVNTTPSASTPGTLFPTDQYSACPVAMMPLGYNWTSLNSKIDAMVANGTTNQTIGLVWGWQSLTQGDPLNPPALPANTQRFIILLSDGLNTQDRWWGNGSQHSQPVDNRMAIACSNAKADGIIIYTVFVDLNGTQGNSDVLQSCASDASKYFDLTTSGAIIDTFNQIGQQITNLRLSR